jgi:flagellin-like protein
MNRKGQISIIYLLITIAIAFILAGGIFLFSKSYRASLSENIEASGLQNIAQRLENSLLDLKLLADKNVTSTNISLDIPQRIGEQKYFISGQGNFTEIRTIGDPSISKNLQINFWPSIDIRGMVDSSKGSITIVLRNSTSVLLQ